MADFRKHGVNYDYIIALKKDENGKLGKEKYPIDGLDDLIDDLHNMLKNGAYDIVDMERAILKEIDPVSLNICIPHEYSRAFINGSADTGINKLEYKSMNQRGMQKELRDHEESIIAKKLTQLKSLAENKRLNSKELQAKAERQTKDEIRKWHYKLKCDFLEKKIGYLQAYAYQLKYNEIKDKVVFISSERIGWKSMKERTLPSWEYKINDDLRVALWSNFCYGSSSRFCIRVIYKDVAICPYSEFVTYRYANATDIINYTRKYGLQRKNWIHVADFVEEFCNKAINDPESFVKKEIMFEIKTLVKELTEIVNSKHDYLKNKFSNGITTSRYSGVTDLRDFDSYELRSYNDNSDEYELLFRMEKISGALKFLESLEKFSTIYRGTRRAIVKIEDLNIEIYPELCERIIPIEDEVSKLKAKVNRYSKIVDKLESEAEKHYKKIESIKKKYKKEENKDKAEESYYKRHPELRELETKIEVYHKRLRNAEHDYNKRNAFLNKLKACKADIEDYGVLDLKD